MSDYPTADEEYEHMYADDLQALDDLNTGRFYFLYFYIIFYSFSFNLILYLNILEAKFVCSIFN